MKIKINGQKLSYLAMKRGMSQQDLAEKSGISRATISAACNGRMLRANSCTKICSALECDPMEIME